MATSAPSIGPIHQTLHQATTPGPNAVMCTPVNSGSGTRQGIHQPPAFDGTSSSSDTHVNHRKTPETQINPPVQNLGTFNQTLLNSQGVVNDSNSFETCLPVDVNPEKMSSSFEPISAHIPLKLKDKAWNGEFIDLSLLLKSAWELVNESSLESDLAIKGGVLAVLSKHINTIRNIQTWTSAFMVYASFMLEKLPNKGMTCFKYLHTVRMAAFRGILLDGFITMNNIVGAKSSIQSLRGELWLLYVSTPNVNNYSPSEFGYADRRQQPPFNSTATSGFLGFNNFQQRNDGQVCRQFNRGVPCKFAHRGSRCKGNHPFTSCRSKMPKFIVGLLT